MVNVKLKLLLILLFFLLGCAEEPTFKINNPSVIPTIPTQQVPPITKPQPKVDSKRQSSVRVKKGDTLYSIGVDSGLGYELLSKWNHISKPYSVRMGQQIKLYDPNIEGSESAALPIAGMPADKSNTADSVSMPQQQLVTPAADTAVDSSSKSPTTSRQKTPLLPEETLMVSKDKQKMLKLYWKWPIKGKLLKSFAQTSNKGIDIAGKDSEASVLAAANGEVVYSGNGLIGYGNLLIIKHDDMYLSAYANTTSLQVNEGQKVTQGQVIARCGTSASGTPSLHFEIRKNGKAVNPLLYLPTQ